MADTSPLAHSPTLGAGPVTEEGDAPLPPGTAVGEYVVERFLGAGAMGRVYAGAHPVIGKQVAIKVLRRELAATVEGAERFKREARAANQVDHPNVVDVFAFGRLPDGRLYLVMDLVAGASLRRALADGPLPVPRALHVLGAIADALDAAHARGVVHRDLKPDNVMLGPGEPPAVAVLDFGLAKLVSAGDAAAPASLLTGRGTWLGTPAYMAPEQWSADGAGPASDRYALGVIAFELLTGRLPFAADTLPEMMERHFRAEVPSVSGGAQPLPTAVDAVLARALAKAPGERFPSARALVEALRAATSGAAASGVAAVAAPPRGRARFVVPALAGAVVLIATVGGVLALRGERAPRPAVAARAPATPAPGVGFVVVRSVPAGAEIRRDGAIIGLTEARLELAAGGEVSLELRKPGFAPARRAVRVTPGEQALPVVTLAEIREFEGVWALPSGELRAFTRRGERVEVSKLDSVHGERRFYRHFAFVPSDVGVAFSSTDELVDPAAPDEPTCRIPRATIYVYDPAADALTVSQEHVKYGRVNGRCVVGARAFAPALTLARADRASTTELETLAPVGTPITAKDAALDDGIGTREGKTAPRSKLDEARKPAPPRKRPPGKAAVKGKQAALPPAQTQLPYDAPPQTSAPGAADDPRELRNVRTGQGASSKP